MNLLIIGAAGHGRVVKEVAEAMTKYNKIDFPDDNSDLAIGKCDEYMSLRDRYTYAFVAFGSNELRSKWTEKLIEAGFEIPILIHPTVYVSPTVNIEQGVVAQSGVKYKCCH
jgi:UDP-N-acetylbacillosamine N-acetyltransferase